MLTTVNSSGYVERVIHDLIASGQYRRHLKRLAKRIEEAAFRAHETMRQLDLPVLGHPAGGFYGWCQLPERLSDAELSRQAAERGIPRFKRFMEGVLGQAHPSLVRSGSMRAEAQHPVGAWPQRPHEGSLV